MLAVLHRMSRLAWVVLVTYFCLMKYPVVSQAPINGPQSYGNECCGLHLMDSASQRVAIETSRSLAPTTYSAVRLRVCSTDPVVVQLWRYIDDVTYEFRWQLQFAPSQTQTTLTYITVPLPSNITTTSMDRVGFYSPGMQGLIVPFAANSTSSVKLSSGTVTNAAQLFTAGQSITLDTYVWPRTFKNYVAFCTAADCSDQPTPVTTSGSSPSDTVTPVASTGGQCCATTVSCDPSPDVTSSLTSQSQSFSSLQRTLDQLSERLSSLVSRNFVTGLCPRGFLSGSYGIGSCYMMVQQRVTLAAAFTSCRNYGANLLLIQSSAENEFIRSFVGNNTIGGESNSVMQFWTQGLHSFEPPNLGWYWYEGLTTASIISSLRKPVLYSAWQNGTTPTPSVSSNNVCLVMTVDRGRNTAYWVNQNCAQNTFFYFCQTPKQCL